MFLLQKLQLFQNYQFIQKCQHIHSLLKLKFISFIKLPSFPMDFYNLLSKQKQNQQMSHTTIQNPESYGSLIPHAAYQNHKNARRQIQNQREQAQHTISFLEREAKKTARELEMKQKSLINYYQLKESRFIESQKKSSLRNRREESLELMRTTNNQLREESSRRKTALKEEMIRSNRRSAQNMKHSRVETERKLSQEKQLENQLLRKRNSAFSRALVLGAEHSKIKVQVDKKYKSSEVKNDLISVQEKIKDRESRKISVLNTRQQELLSIVEKNRKQKRHYEQTLNQFQTLPFRQIYPTIKKESTSRRTSSRRSSLRSESLFI